MTTDDAPLTVAQAAAALGVKPGTVYALCRAGDLGHMRIGVGRGTIRIEPADLERFKADARLKGATAGGSTPYKLKHLIPQARR